MQTRLSRRAFSAPVAAAQLEDGSSDMPFSVIDRQTVWGHQLRWTPPGNIAADPTNPAHVVVVWSDRGAPNPNATTGCNLQVPEPPRYDPCNAGPGSNTNIYFSESFDRGVTWSGRRVLSADARHEWFPWSDFRPNGTLATAWDQDEQAPTGFPPANDTFRHVLKSDINAAGAAAPLGPSEHLDVSVTHWAGQYVALPAWPTVCGPAGYPEGAGKDCNAFHGDYTGLAAGPDGRVHVVWTGLNRFEQSLQLDPYTGGLHDGYAQDAMYARR